uniref:ATPase 8, plasma membrane-type n=1 Tax=Cajanus cajan TaxID=3821 RepID=A0A151QT76_CAJCA|nr:ATPase 8, plasma membrane-type [Cajanus cajan]
MENLFLWVMEAVTIIVVTLANGGNKVFNWKILVEIIVLLLINLMIYFMKKNNVYNVAATLIERVFQDGKWIKEIARILISSEKINVKLKDVKFVDAYLL